MPRPLRLRSATAATGDRSAHAASPQTKAERSFKAFRQHEPIAQGNPFRDGQLTDAQPPRARHLRAAKPGWTLWAAPGNEDVCLDSRGPASGRGSSEVCAPIDETIANGLFGLSHPALDDGAAKDTVELVGMFADGVASVTVDLSDGSTRRIDVVDNAIADTFTAAPVSATWVDSSNLTHEHKFGGR